MSGAGEERDGAMCRCCFRVMRAKAPAHAPDIHRTYRRSSRMVEQLRRRRSHIHGGMLELWPLTAGDPE
jgi:hypothetical protein